jgi:hypothetical protein
MIVRPSLTLWVGMMHKLLDWPKQQCVAMRVVILLRFVMDKYTLLMA